MKPTITVLMPVFNAENYLTESIQSVLNQTYADFELLIVNDASTDNSRKVIKSFDDSRIRLVDNPTNLGVTKTLNRGLSIARGEYIARQDADDRSYPNRLSQQLRFLKDNPEVVLLGSSARAIDAAGKPMKMTLRSPVGLPAIRWTLMFNTAFIHTSVMFNKRIIWEEMGGYNELFPRSQDFELWSRVARRFVVGNLPQVLVDRRHEYGSVVSGLPRVITPFNEVIYNNLKAFLQSTDIPDKWANIINDIKRNPSFKLQHDWNYVIRMYRQIYFMYCQRYPEAEQDKTIRSHLARSFYDVAYYSAPINRKASLRALVRALKLDFTSKERPALIKYIALWCFGERVWHAYRRFHFE
jgi:glycosyltransferase involved in cell wall biosynthesis